MRFIAYCLFSTYIPCFIHPGVAKLTGCPLFFNVGYSTHKAGTSIIMFSNVNVVFFFCSWYEFDAGLFVKIVYGLQYCLPVTLGKH